ncbi:MAG: hypothetical protein E7291_06590 [Lachnospiraceae bacterium]|nr:hypothetical protein [Lachnospiraceae bacterium]
MADWNDIKKAFERDAQKANQALVANEQRLLKSIANYLCSQKGVSAVQGYKPEEVMVFLEKPVTEVKTCLGGDWLSMDDESMETLIYTLSKKVKKMGNLIQW